MTTAIGSLERNGIIQMKLSIVSTLYMSAPHVEEFVKRVQAAAEQITTDYEIILVNDDSPDESLPVALRLFESEPRLQVVDLAANYGHYAAMLAGLAHTHGDVTFLIDSDLEEAPELLDQLWPELKEGRDVVFAYQLKRSRDFFSNITGELFYRIIGMTSGRQVRSNAMVARLMVRDYVDRLTGVRARPISFDVLTAEVAGNQFGVGVEKGSGSRTTYTLGRRLEIFVDSLLGYGSAFAVMLCLAGALTLGAALFVDERTVCIVGGIVLFALAGVARTAMIVLEELRYRPPHVRHLYSHDLLSDE